MRDHLFIVNIIRNYTVWTWHGDIMINISVIQLWCI